MKFIKLFAYLSIKGIKCSLKLYASRWAKIFQENQTWEKMYEVK
jgi:hypothetical protein